MYGVSQLSQSRVFLPLLPAWFQGIAPYATGVSKYLAVFPALLSFRELSLGPLRPVIQFLLLWELAIGIAAAALFLLKHSSADLMFYNQLFWVGMMVILTAVVAVPRWASRYLVLPDRGVLAVGVLVFMAEALFNNISHAIGSEPDRALDDAAFAILLFSFAYVALQLVLGKERRLFAMEQELSMARDIQQSILPAKVPDLRSLRVSATYRPMTAVAGDFCEFLAVDEYRAGFLVADVCGHGVPAALVASMIKVAIQPMNTLAGDPAQVMCGLNRVLSAVLRGQMLSAAYLWLDTENGSARYAAAGHPPLLLWRQGKLARVESNGLIIGIMPGYDAYPVYTTQIAAGDRILLYTDGLVEPENVDGQPFGDSRLEQVLRSHQDCDPADLSRQLLDELRQWQHPPGSLQDDVTLLIIDVIEASTLPV